MDKQNRQVKKRKEKKIDGSAADKEAKWKQAWSGYGRCFAAPCQL